jgi:hypothetical protein
VAVTGQVTRSGCLSTPTVNQEVGGSNPPPQSVVSLAFSRVSALGTDKALV